MKTTTELIAENDRLRALLVEARTAILTSGCGDDKLLARIRQEINPLSPHDLPLGRPSDV